MVNGILNIYNLILALFGALTCERFGRRKLWIYATGGMLVAYTILIGKLGNVLRDVSAITQHREEETECDVFSRTITSADAFSTPSQLSLQLMPSRNQLA